MVIMTMMTTMTTTTKNMMTTKQLAGSEPGMWEWLQHKFKAMNTDIHLSVIAPDPRPLIRTVEESFIYFEQLLSRFRPDSELSQLNKNQGLIFPASYDFFAAVEAALWAAQQTSGIYDPTILGYLETAGYDCTFGALPNPKPLFRDSISVEDSPASITGFGEELTGLDYRHIDLDSFTQTILLPSGLRLDLGGMGKGWTVDRVADLLCDKGHFLLNAGGDIYAYGSPNQEGGWDVHLAHPLMPDLDYASLKVDHHAVTTSTVTGRRWLKNGIIQHHLIDPRTGLPALSDVIAASVIAGRTFTAEIFAKAALILGVEEGLAYLESLPEVEGVLFSNKNEIICTSQIDRFLYRMEPSGYLSD